MNGDPKTKPVDKLLGDECGKIKRSFGYYVKKNQHWSKEKFCGDARCVYLHLFNDHSKCDAYWCSALKARNETDPVKKKELEEKDNKKKYRSTNTAEEKALKDKVAKKLEYLLVESKMKEVYHPYQTQKNEALQRQATAVCPKDRFLGGRMQLHDRLRLVAILDSLGQYEGFARLFHSLGLPHMHRIMGLWANRKDVEDNRKHDYRQLPSSKRKRAWDKIASMKANCLKDKRAKKNSCTYESGIANTDNASGKDTV